MKTKIIASITSWEDWVNLPEQLKDADAVELRLDSLPPEIRAEQILEHFPSYPVLITPRSPAEGGMRPYDLEERVAMARALISKAWALDWEISSMADAPELLAEAKRGGVELIASMHDFEKLPALDYLTEQEYRARRLGADIVKFAFMLQNEDEMYQAQDLIGSQAIAIMGMGPWGPESRILYSKKGSCLVYGYLGDRAAAPGQIPVAQLRKALT